MKSSTTRRHFLKQATTVAATAALMRGTDLLSAEKRKSWYQGLSISQWALHNAFFAKKLDPIDFAKISSREYGIHGLEYVNQFFMDKARDQKYINELIQRASGEGCRSLLIMVDDEGDLAHPD